MLVFLGLELDMVEGTVRLPEEKLHRLQAHITVWAEKKSCTKRELLSLIGQLQHACCAVRSGRSFLRRMITLSTKLKELDHYVRLNKEFRSDLHWWATFLPSWNGKSMFTVAVSSPWVATITSDASGTWGCGAFTETRQWFQSRWPTSWDKVHITSKELLPLVVSAAVWGSQWRGNTIRARCDNAAVVAIIRSGYSKDPLAMQLIRNLFFITAHYNLLIVTVHVPGVENVAADALSRDNLSLFRSQVRHAQPDPTVIPAELLQLLVSSRQDWTSTAWINLWQNFLRKV